MANIELKPCPFCGGRGKLEKTGPLIYVKCQICGACGSTAAISEEYCANDKAAEKWNRRESLWRNAEQNPPEENTPVLCYAVSTAGEGHFKVIGVLRNKEFWFLQVNDARWSSFPNMQLRVTHWQPLPEDPEEE